MPPAASKQISATTEPGMLASDASKAVEIMFSPLGVKAEGDKLIEKDICNRFPCPRL